MKSAHFLMALASFGMTVLSVSGQEAASVKIDGKPLKPTGVETPQFSASNVGDRRWRPKTWLELDLELDLKLARDAGGRSGSLDTMTVNFYIGFPGNALTQNKGQLLKGTLTYTDIPSNETSHALAFVAPATLRRLLQKDNFTPTSDIQAWGYEIMVNGTLVEGKSSHGTTKWWENPNVMAVDGAILPKKETPFSILWGDYDLAVKK
jgi:hypothetical protein